MRKVKEIHKIQTIEKIGNNVLLFFVFFSSCICCFNAIADSVLNNLNQNDFGIDSSVIIKVQEQTKKTIKRADDALIEHEPNKATTDQKQIDQAKTRTADVLSSVSDQDLNSAKNSTINVENLPAVNNPKLSTGDIQNIVDMFNKKIQHVDAKKETNNYLLILVSFSIPKDSLERLMYQAELFNAIIVFRGLKNNNMQEMKKTIFDLKLKHNIKIIIDPPMFSQFKVINVPTIVLANSIKNNLTDAGCARADSYIKISGDISLYYALEKITQLSKPWKKSAEYFIDIATKKGFIYHE